MASATTQLDEDSSWALLTSGSFGHVALSVRAMPMIIAVRYTVGHRTLRVRPPEDAGLDGALAQSVVAFQADGYDDDAQRAWSVHAVGKVIGHDTPDFDIRPMVIEGRWLAFS